MALYAQKVSYRDELEASHARNVALEGELADDGEPANKKLKTP